ncbi:MAG: HAMP domain-containing protein [Deltaproteobacteria bacterium]|nr:HAMP domain-containing protein [Deltaproteobacteria bacterium]
MKVATKFALAFLASGILSVLVYSSVAATREAQRTEQTVAEDLASLGRTLSLSVMSVWERDGETRAFELVGYHNSDERVDVRWIWLDVDAEHSQSAQAGVAVVPSLRRGDQQTWISTRADGARLVYAYIPLLREGKRPAAIELSRPLDSQSVVFWNQVREQLVASTVVAIFATFLAVVLTTFIVSRPLARVGEQARRIGAGDLSHRLTVKGRDEVSSLVSDLNAMADQLAEARDRADREAEKRLSALEQLRHADRLRTVGTLASGIAHELGTPLAVIAMRAKAIASGEVPKDDAPESAKIIASQADRVTKIVRQLLDFARRRQPKRAEADLRDLADRATHLLAALAKKANVKLEVAESPEPVLAHVDAGQLEQALTNLVINAVHAMPNGGTIKVSARNEEAAPPAAPDSPRPCAVLEVRDEGTGIAAENLERIFEPFFTTKAVGEGTGLGLSVTHGIVEDHEGWMTAQSVVGKGSTFTLFLPVEVLRDSMRAE